MHEKNTKFFLSTEIGLDVNDLKILIHASFQYITESCQQWAKEHPFVAGVVFFFYFLYVFLPSLFSILFYSFPLVICTAIILGGRLNLQNIRKIHIHGDENGSYMTTARHCMSSMRAPPSRITHKTVMKCKTGSYKEDMKILRDKIISDEMIHKRKNDDPLMKIQEEKQEHGSNHEENHSPSHLEVMQATIKEHQVSTPDLEPSKKDSQDEEENQKNLTDLGNRLESLMAKRRARKQLSMQPRRNLLALGYNYDHRCLMEPITIARMLGETEEGHPGSAPSKLLPKRNPFDLPYDPFEERPVLTGGSFEEELFNFLPKDIQFSRHESFSLWSRFRGGIQEDDPVNKPLHDFMAKPWMTEDSCRNRIRSESDAEESIEVKSEQISQEDQSNSLINRGSYDLEDNNSTTAHDLENLDQQEANCAPTCKKENEDTESNKEENNLDMEPIIKDDVERKTTYSVRNNDYEDDAISSSSSSIEMSINTSKNEAFRNSVRKVLTCLVIPRSKAMCESNSYYKIDGFHHNHKFSIASDMQVELSETGSPTAPVDNIDESLSPSDKDSLVYDGDVDRDVNSGDEELWGASPYPIRLANQTRPKLRLSDAGDEGGSSHDSNHVHTIYSPRDVMEFNQNREEDNDVGECKSSVSSSYEDIAYSIAETLEHPDDNLVD